MPDGKTPVAAVDIRVMDWDGTEVRKSYRAFAESVMAPFIDEGERTGTVPRELVRRLGEEGFLGRTLPVEHGGRGGSMLDYVLQQEELSRVWASGAGATTWNTLSGILIARFGSDEQRTSLNELASGATTAGVAFTEPSGGSDIASLRSVARRSGDGWVLSGSKRLIDNALGGEFFIVAARTDPLASPPHRGITLFIVRRDDPGFHFGGVHDLLGLRASGVGWFELQDCWVGSERVLGQLGRGFYQMMAMLEFGRTNVAAMALGVAQGAFEQTKSYVRAREVGGEPLANKDLVRASIADMASKIEASRAFTYSVARMIDGQRRCDRESAMAKLFASEMATIVTANALQLHGGIGFTTTMSVERFFRDSRIFQVGEGSSDVLRLLIGRRELVDE